MASLLERLRRALAPKYTVERTIASGGMGVVFLGHNTRLQSRVAIKVLKPELATADMEASFGREARLLAKLKHPNIVTIHDVDIADGIFYYVMDFIDGETVADRIKRGPLDPDETLRLGLDLLSALETVHRVNVIHRDIKPANIFLVEGRGILVDFGIAHVDTTESTATRTGVIKGTPAYMPPEQRVGISATPRTDLYALSMVLYECTTGEKWDQSVDSDDGNWISVPRPLARALRKALKQNPAERWPDAAGFRNALAPKKGPGRIAMAITAGIIALIGVISWFVLRSPPPAGDTNIEVHSEIDLAIQPFAITGSIGEEQTSLGVELAEAVRQALMPIPRLRLEGVVDSSGAGAAHWYTEGSLARRGNQWVLSFTLADRLGPSHTRTYATSEPLPYVLADSVAQEIVDLLFPELELRRWMGTTPLVAIGEYIQGLLAFQKDHWNTADNRFAAAIEIDSSFALARWWQLNAKKLGRRPIDLGSLQRIFSKDEKAFSPLDSLLITARLEPNLEARLQLYDEAVEEYGSRYYAALFRGVELFQRGALAGHSLNEALVALGEARSIDPQVGWAHNQLIWAYIRLGRKAEAEDALGQRREITTDASPGDPDIFTLFEWAYMERFEPEKAAVFLDSVLRNPDSPLLRDVGTMLRLASSLDLPGIQIELGLLMAKDTRRGPHVRANGHTGRGLAEIMTGRPVTGMHLLDSASTIWASSEQRLLAEEMRLMLPVFGIPIPPDEMESARSWIESLLNDATLGTRAAWALAIDARQRGDADTARQWRRRVTSKAERGPYHLPLDTVLLALEDADGGDLRGALERSRPLLEIDSAGRGSDPFARALLYWHRAKWWEALGDTARAEREWLWYENVDFGPWPTGVLQPAEIDWMLSTYARLNRARAQLSLPNREAEACVHLRRVVELWANAEPDILPKKQQADSLIANRCAA